MEAMMAEIRYRTFGEFLEEQHGGWAEDGGRCSSCMRESPRLTAGIQGEYYVIGNRICEFCVNYAHGAEQGRQDSAEFLRTVLSAALNGGVRG